MNTVKHFQNGTHFFFHQACIFFINFSSRISFFEIPLFIRECTFFHQLFIQSRTFFINFSSSRAVFFINFSSMPQSSPHRAFIYNSRHAPQGKKSSPPAPPLAVCPSSAGRPVLPTHSGYPHPSIHPLAPTCPIRRVPPTLPTKPVLASHPPFLVAGPARPPLLLNEDILMDRTIQMRFAPHTKTKEAAPAGIPTESKNSFAAVWRIHSFAQTGRLIKILPHCINDNNYLQYQIIASTLHWHQQFLANRLTTIAMK